MSELSERHEIVSDPPLSIATKERRSGIELSVVTASIVVGVLMLLVAFNVQSTDENYCVKKGDQCCESKHYERAKEWYQKAIDKNPKNTAANLGMGRAYLGLETDANYYMGRAYLELNEYDQGITCLRHAARLGHKEAQETLQKTGHSW
jgi:tetratricopeptide (TPR) repeat protein